MNRYILLASLCAALLCVSVAARADGSMAIGQTLATGTTRAAYPPPPKASPEIEKLLKDMNKADTWGHPDLFGEYAGMKRLFAGDYEGALKYLKIGARYADKLSQLSIGLMYLNGRGVQKDPAIACAWLTLASERNYPTFIRARNGVCGSLNPAQRSKATAKYDELLPEYGDKTAKHRLALEMENAKRQMTGSRVGFDFGLSSCGTTTQGTSINAGCSSKDFWEPWRWDPNSYFAARDAEWYSTVTVGPLQGKNTSAAGRHQQNVPSDAPQSPRPKADH